MSDHSVVKSSSESGRKDFFKAKDKNIHRKEGQMLQVAVKDP